MIHQFGYHTMMCTLSICCEICMGTPVHGKCNNAPVTGSGAPALVTLTTSTSQKSKEVRIKVTCFVACLLLVVVI